MERILTCTLCPQGCILETMTNEGELMVQGNRCNRGKKYAEAEIFYPVRTLTATVKVKGGIYPLVPAKSHRPIPKEMLRLAMQEIALLEVEAPVQNGQILIEDLARTGVSLVATREIQRG